MSTCQLTFQSIISYSVGDNAWPYSIAINDLNSDGHLDLAVANYDADNIGILFGNGDGSFHQQITYSTGANSQPSSIIVDDFNHDNHLDLAVGNRNTGSIGVLLGNGDGSFGQQMIFSTESRFAPQSVVIGDFNNDNHTDLTVANLYTNNVGILLGNGDGTFREEITLSIESLCSPTAIGVGNLNNDSQLDLAILCPGYNTIKIIFGNGDGTFGTQITLSTGQYSSPISIAVGDLNHDNHLDLVVANSETDNIGVLLGNGNGIFERQITYSTGSSTYPRWVIVGDFNNDNQLDVAVANQGGHSISILLGIGNGSFRNRMTFSTGTRSSLVTINIDDFNNDGKLDIVVGDGPQASVGILLNTCDCC